VTRFFAVLLFTAVVLSAQQYGAFIDFGYLYDPNWTSTHAFAFRGTTPVIDQPEIDMAAVYMKKDASEKSRWGAELTLQAGKDSEAFGYSAVAPNLPGSKWLRHIGLADVSYLAPVGSGLTLQAGIFSSLIGYESLYAKDNLTYTRSWGADNTPYLMIGANASYAFTPKFSGTVALITGYAPLSDANHVPSTVVQGAYKAGSAVTLKETALYGPHQGDTAVEFWRFLSDTIVERKTARLTTAFEYQLGHERVAEPAKPHALWMAAQLPVHVAVHGPWSVTVRPEVAWDRNGRWTGQPQTIKSAAGTLEYKVPYRWTSTIARLEYRYDSPAQHLLIAGLIVVLGKQP
jgi:hypothetical protein